MGELWHVGTLYYSGRYPWGSGENPYQRWNNFYSSVKKMRDEGLTEKQIADALGIKVNKLRQRIAYGKDDRRYADALQAQKLKDKGYSIVAIGEKMGIGESTVRSYLDPVRLERTKITGVVANKLKEEVDKGVVYLDVGKNVERHLGVTPHQLTAAISKLEDDGYTVHTVKLPQINTGKMTTYKLLCPPGTEFKDVMLNKDRIKPIEDVEVQASKDGGRTFRAFETPRSVDSKRIQVNYAEDGGNLKDGLIELRRGVDDISLGNARYAQVRIAVDDKYYLKGMAVYRDDMPDGVDIIFNTNKSPTGNKLDAFKEMKTSSLENPFGANIRTEDELLRAQKYYIDKNGKEQLSCLNIVNEEGTWEHWSKNLSSQMLSKQSPSLARQQLKLDYDIRAAEYNDIKELTNPAIKKKLLRTFSDECDSAAAHLKAAALPRQNTRVLIPVDSLKDNEIYAPTYNNGDVVVLIRHPHGGKFEIPQLIVNNKNKEAIKMLANEKGPPLDAVGINARVAQQLSGADFDGDTVLVIPNEKKYIQTMPPLKGLQNFDPKTAYPAVEGMKVMGKPGGGNTDVKMGDISNLITDMTIKGADFSEIERAVKHSMVVIDAENHKLNYVKSYEDNGIAALKKKYQGSAQAGASTIISRATSDRYVDEIKDYYRVDPKTGKLIVEPTGNTYIHPKTGKLTKRKTRYDAMDLVDDAFKLTSTPLKSIEAEYATYANKLKAMANEARKEMVATKGIPRSASATEVYLKEVNSLESKLNRALKNSPLERQAQVVANVKVNLIKQDNPNLDKKEIKKIGAYELKLARERLGAKKELINPTPKEWKAIQSGAFSNSKLTQIIENSDVDRIKELATPRQSVGISDAKANRAIAMLARGYTQAEVANHLGISVSSVNKIANE